MEVEAEIIAAHRHSSGNRSELLASEICGCFYCCETFSPEAIKYWIPERDGGETAQCPNCHVDSVIGDASGFAITDELLERMRKHWF